MPTNLQTVLKLWLDDGDDHTQTRFSAMTGIDSATTSHLFNGRRGFTEGNRAAVMAGFAEDLPQALRFLKADLEDQIPARARPYLRVLLEEPSLVREKKGGRVSKVELAKRMLIQELENEDPGALEMALGLWNWKNKR